MSFYIFDLDGTLADCSHRVSMLDQSPRPWPAFFAACIHDTPIQSVINLANVLDQDGFNEVEIWTGRSDLVRDETNLWLRSKGVYAPLTRMRRADDHRQDDELKRDWLNESRAAGRTPDMVFEDRARVVAMWRAEGITCCQVAAGDF